MAVYVGVCVIREMRSKHFLSSTLGLTWQVSRFSLVGGLFGCRKEEETRKTSVFSIFWCHCKAPRHPGSHSELGGAERQANDVILNTAQKSPSRIDHIEHEHILCSAPSSPSLNQTHTHK